jgi:endo-1,4-beta-xylanase
MQGHYHFDWPTMEQVDATIAAFKALGVKVAITELDIDMLPAVRKDHSADVSAKAEAVANSNPYVAGLPPEQQKALADLYASLFRVFLKYRGTVTRVTFWGLTDRTSWLNNFPAFGRTNYPLLFDRAGKPKPAFDAVVNAARAAH